MGLLFVFLLGIGNFVAHMAVLESNHPVLGRVPWFFHLLGGKFSLAVEFGMLLGALLMIDSGSLAWVLFYGCYSAVNLAAAWLILSRRI